MARRTVGRRVLAALAGSTPAFVPRASEEHGGSGGRLLAALGGSTPAFSGENADEYTSSPVSQTYEVYSVTTLLARGSSIREFTEQAV